MGMRRYACRRDEYPVRSIEFSILFAAEGNMLCDPRVHRYA